MMDYFYTLFEVANGAFLTAFCILATLVILMEKVVATKCDEYESEKSLESIKQHLIVIVVAFLARIALGVLGYGILAEGIMLGLLYDYVKKGAELADKLGWDWLSKALEALKLIKGGRE